MVNKCGVYKCRSGYDGKMPPGVSMHSFPSKNPELRRQWIEAIERPPEWSPSSNSVICSLHFLPTDFTMISSDINPTRRRRNKEQPLKRRKLLPNVVPSVFKILGGSDIKHYQNLSELKEELESWGEKSLPEDVRVFERGKDFLHFVGFSFDTETESPKVNYSLNVKSDLSFTMSVKGEEAPISITKSAAPNGRIHSFMALNDVLNLLRSQLSQENPNRGVKELSHTLKRIKKSVIALPETDKRRNKLLFLLEQLELALHSKETYSRNLLTLGVLWNSSAPRLYRALSSSGRLLQLPSTRVIQSFAALPIANLQERLSKSNNDRDKLLNLIVTETPSLEYSGVFESGKYLTHGYRETLLTIAIRGYVSDEECVLRMFPLNELNSVFIRDKIFETVEILTKIGFKVVSIVLDVGPPFQELYIRELFEEDTDRENSQEDDVERYIENPYDQDCNNRIYILFNPRQCLESLLSCWLKVNKFDLPSFRSKEIGQPEVRRVEDCLTNGNANIKYFGKSAIKNADYVFSENTMNGLDEGSTKEFVKLILKFSKISLEVSSYNPIGRLKDSRIIFLKDFAKWVEEWSHYGDSSMRLPQSLIRIFRTTSSGLAGLISYLLEEKDLNISVVTSGLLSLKKEENSWNVNPFTHRTLIGLEQMVSIKKRVISSKNLAALMGPHMEKLEHIFISHFEEDDSDFDFPTKEIYDESIAIADAIEDDDLFFKSSRESDALYVLAAFAAESLLQRLGNNSQCEGCSELIGDCGDAPTVIFEEPSSSNKDVEVAFANAVSEKGMNAPSHLLFASCLIIRKYYISLTMSEFAQSRMQTSSHSNKNLFIRVVEIKMNRHEETERILNSTCSSEDRHPFRPFFRELCGRLFDLFCRNASRKRKIVGIMTVGPSSDGIEEINNSNPDQSNFKSVEELVMEPIVGNEIVIGQSAITQIKEEEEPDVKIAKLK